MAVIRFGKDLAKELKKLSFEDFCKSKNVKAVLKSRNKKLPEIDLEKSYKSL